MKKTLAIMLLIVMSMSLVFAQGSSEAKKTEESSTCPAGSSLIWSTGQPQCIKRFYRY